MKRSVLRFGAIIGAAAVSALAAGPALAAAPVSQATAQSIELHLGGQSLIAQKQTATNNGTKETRSDNDTVPNLVGVLPDNNALKAAVLPQEAHANANGTSFACAGLASDGNGGPGVVTVGKESCDLDGSGAITVNLGGLSLGDALIAEDNTAIGQALQALDPTPLGDLLDALGTNLDGAVAQISDALNGTPLGEINLTGALGVISATCAANPEAARGDATLANSTLRLTVPGTTPITLVNLPIPVHPNENQKVVSDLSGATTLVTNGLKTYLETFIQGQFAGTPLADLPGTVQTEIINQLAAGLEPLTDAISQYLAEITLRETTHGDNGRSIDVTALHAEVLPAVKAQVGEALVDGRIGRVTCGPNRAAGAEAGSPQGGDNGGGHNPTPDIPNLVNSGVAGHADHTARNVLGATAALLLLAGSAGLIGYRRMLQK